MASSKHSHHRQWHGYTDGHGHMGMVTWAWPHGHGHIGMVTWASHMLEDAAEVEHCGYTHILSY